MNDYSTSIPDDWTESRLQDACESVTVGHVGSTSEFYEEVGVLFLRTGNLMSEKITLNDVKYIGTRFHDKLRKSQIRPGDVLVSRVGYTGSAALVPHDFPEANCANIIIIRSQFPDHRMALGKRCR
jgi:type I restriction enzyme S subunit